MAAATPIDANAFAELQQKLQKLEEENKQLKEAQMQSQINYDLMLLDPKTASEIFACVKNFLTSSPMNISAEMPKKSDEICVFKPFEEAFGSIQMALTSWFLKNKRTNPNAITLYKKHQATLRNVMCRLAAIRTINPIIFDMNNVDLREISNTIGFDLKSIKSGLETPAWDVLKMDIKMNGVALAAHHQKLHGVPHAVVLPQAVARRDSNPSPVLPPVMPAAPSVVPANILPPVMPAIPAVVSKNAESKTLEPKASTPIQDLANAAAVAAPIAVKRKAQDDDDSDVETIERPQKIRAAAKARAAAHAHSK